MLEMDILPTWGITKEYPRTGTWIFFGITWTLTRQRPIKVKALK
jgi:hypothetical protein